MSLEVLVADAPMVTITSVAVEDLRRRALLSPKRRARICAHQKTTDTVHEMLIAIARESYIRPHLHLHKSESFHVVSGELDLVLFDDQGVVTARHALGDSHSGLPFFYRAEDVGYHTVLVRSDIAVIHETTRGPFVAKDTEYAPWAPDELDHAGVKRFLAALQADIRQ